MDWKDSWEALWPPPADKNVFYLAYHPSHWLTKTKSRCGSSFQKKMKIQRLERVFWKAWGRRAETNKSACVLVFDYSRILIELSKVTLLSGQDGLEDQNSHGDWCMLLQVFCTNIAQTSCASAQLVWGVSRCFEILLLSAWFWFVCFDLWCAAWWQ